MLFWSYLNLTCACVCLVGAFKVFQYIAGIDLIKLSETLIQLKLNETEDWPCILLDFYYSENDDAKLINYVNIRCLDESDHFTLTSMDILRNLDFSNVKLQKALFILLERLERFKSLKKDIRRLKLRSLLSLKFEKDTTTAQSNNIRMILDIAVLTKSRCNHLTMTTATKEENFTNCRYDLSLDVTNYPSTGLLKCDTIYGVPISEEKRTSIQTKLTTNLTTLSNNHSAIVHRLLKPALLLDDLCFTLIE